MNPDLFRREVSAFKKHFPMYRYLYEVWEEYEEGTSARLFAMVFGLHKHIRTELDKDGK